MRGAAQQLVARSSRVVLPPRAARRLQCTCAAGSSGSSGSGPSPPGRAQSPPRNDQQQQAAPSSAADHHHSSSGNGTQQPSSAAAAQQQQLLASAAAWQRPQHPQRALQQAPPMQQFEVVSEAPVHSRYLAVYDRRVRFCAREKPDDCRVLDFDVVGHPRCNFRFAVTFPFHPSAAPADGGGQVTLIREYAQGPNAMTYCLPTGGLDPKRHGDDLQLCAAGELSEEAWLAGGAWHRLLPDGHPGLPEVKWCRNRFLPFLVVDPQPDPNPGSRDAEEASMEVLRVPLAEFRRLMVSGEMLLPSVTTAYMALDKLKELGLLPASQSSS